MPGLLEDLWTIGAAMVKERYSWRVVAPDVCHGQQDQLGAQTLQMTKWEKIYMVEITNMGINIGIKCL